MTKEAFKFTGDDALHYERYLGPLLFEPSAAVFMSHLGPTNVQSVLETSCGTGRLTRHLRSHFPATTKLIASDISPDMLEVAKEKLKDLSIDFQVADAQQLPFSDDSFDLVLCQYGVMFLADKQKGFDEAFRVLRPGGRFIFSTWDSTENIPLLHLLLDELFIPFFKAQDETRFRVPFSLHDPEKLNDFLASAGFTKNNVFPITFKSGKVSHENVVNGLFLKHPLSRQVADIDPTAVEPMAADMIKKMAEQFDGDPGVFDLKAFIGIGNK